MHSQDGSAEHFRVVVEPGGHHLLNMGDVAMLQVAVDRMVEAWPAASIEVLTSAPERLTRFCPRAIPLPAQGRYDWIDRPVERDGVARRAIEAVRRGRRTGPVGARFALAAERGLRGAVSPDARRYLGALSGASAYVVSGRGGICDAFPFESRAVLHEVEIAADLGLPTAMLGQGLGPIHDEELHERARLVLPRVDLFGLREGRAAQPLLESLGVPPDRIEVTGDDAVERALALAEGRRWEYGIGVNLRAAAYADVRDADVDRVGAVLREQSARRGTELVPVPISVYTEESDADTIGRLTGSEYAQKRARGYDDVDAAIRQAARCRVLVTGSYHAGVFAMARGVPAVGLARSGYYVDKLEGLADTFGGGMTVLSLDDPDLEERLHRAIDAGWDTPEEDRERLVASARRQAAASRAAWDRLFELVAARRPAARLR